MKQTIILLASTLLLAACHGNRPSAQAGESKPIDDSTATKQTEKPEAEPQPKYDPADASSFGLTGQVRSVSTQQFATYESDGELKEDSPTGSYEMRFNPWGHIVRDEWGNEYGYDADGNYYRGNHTYTTVKRDKAGRITEYTDTEANSGDESDLTMKFQYDKRGRLATVCLTSMVCHWTEKRHYQGTSLQPSNSETLICYEGEEGETKKSVTYSYTRYDEQGNWTERTCVTTTTEPAETMEYETDTEDEEEPEAESENPVKITETITIEKRAIDYYE